MALLPMLLAAALVGAVSVSQFRFRRDSVCPPATVPTAKQLQGVHSEPVCSVECALRPDCAVYNFASATGECLMGSTQDLLTGWTGPANCSSQLNPSLPGALSFRSSLIAFLDFRRGQINLVNASRFNVTATSSSVSFDSAGARFAENGGNPSYIELYTGNPAELGDLLSRGSNFSVYAKVHRRANYTQMYYTMTSCSNYTIMRGGMGHFEGRLSAFHSVTNPNEMAFRMANETITDVTDATEPTVAASAGVAFQQNNFTHAFYNGQLMHLQVIAGASQDFTGKPECIRLGFGDKEESLVGYYTCFALVGKALSAQEFAELEAVCA